MFDKELFLITVLFGFKVLFQKIILINLLEIAFCENNIVVQKFKIITSSTIRK